MSSKLQKPDAYGSLSEPTTLTFQRLLPGPIERVWAHLTDSDLRKKWLASGAMQIEVGAPFELVWRNDDLTAAKSARPASFPQEHRMEGRITEVEAPHRLAITWGRSDGVMFVLEPRGEQVLLTLTHRRLPDREAMLNVSAGWHMHLEVLATHLAGEASGPFWDGWSRLKREYETRIPS